MEGLEDCDDEELGLVSGSLLVVSGSKAEARGGDVGGVGLPERGADQPESAVEEQEVTNEAKFYDDVIGAQIPEIVDVAASSGGDLGIDALRTKPKFGDVSSRLLVVSCLKEEAGGSDVGVGAMASAGDCGAGGGGWTGAAGAEDFQWGEEAGAEGEGAQNQRTEGG